MKKQIPISHQPWMSKGQPGPWDLEGIPVRGILIGAVLACMLNIFDAYATNIIRGSYLTLNFSTPAALFFFFFVVVIAAGLTGLVHRLFALTRSELITIYFMLVVACCIPGMGFTQFMIPCLLGSTYYATPENNWDNLYNQYIPQWMIPRGENVARYFFEGLPEGGAIPWEAWAGPLSLWYGFFLALAFAMICSMVILRRQWVDREKLVYPLVQVPMEMIEKERGGTIGKSFFTNKVMWAGFAVSFILISINGLHSYYPSFPQLNRTFFLPLFGNTGLNFWFSPPWTGFFYFVNLDITASIWIFYVLTTLQRAVFNTIGLQSTQQIDFYSIDPYLAHQGMGSMIVFVLVGLWVARGHLKEVFAKALRGSDGIDDSGEIITYRQAVVGLFGGLLLVAFWLSMIGLPFPAALLFVFGAMVLFMGLTRVVAEGGIPAMRPPIMTSSFVISAIGPSALGASGLVALGFSYGWHAEIRSFVMSSVANGLKMSEIITGSKRRLFWAVIIAVLVSLAGSSYVTIVMAYKYGGINLNPLFFVNQAPQFAPRDMAPRIAAELAGPRWDAWLFMGVGGSVMGALMWARHHFLWWPLNPLGYTISANWKTGHIFCAALLAWFLKLVILRYGGPQLYRNLRPFFLGLILGEIIAAGGWLVADFFTGHIGSFLTQV